MLQECLNSFNEHLAVTHRVRGVEAVHLPEGNSFPVTLDIGFPLRSESGVLELEPEAC